MNQPAWDAYIRTRIPHLVHILDRHGVVALCAHVLRTEMHLVSNANDEGLSPFYGLESSYIDQAVRDAASHLGGPLPPEDVVEIHILMLQDGVEHVVLEDGTSLVGPLSSSTDTTNHSSSDEDRIVDDYVADALKHYSYGGNS